MDSLKRFSSDDKDLTDTAKVPSTCLSAAGFKFMFQSFPRIELLQWHLAKARPQDLESSASDAAKEALYYRQDHQAVLNLICGAESIP